MNTIILILIIIYLILNNKSYNPISISKARKLIKNKKIKSIVDVRTIEEWLKEHHPEAIHLPIEPSNQINKNSIKEIKEPVLIYCRSGRRAKNAAKIMHNLGVRNIYIINENYKKLL